MTLEEALRREVKRVIAARADDLVGTMVRWLNAVTCGPHEQAALNDVVTWTLELNRTLSPYMDGMAGEVADWVCRVVPGYMLDEALDEEPEEQTQE